MTNLSEQIGNFDVISFDVFDTLLLRSVMDPADVFAIVEEQSGARGFASARGMAGRNSLQAAVCSGRGERSLDEIYALIPEYAHLRGDELVAEDRLLVGNPEMISLYNEARRQGKKVVIVSDMYLSGDFIKKKLHDAGIEGWDGFFLSSERMCRKDSGALFDVMLKDLGVAPQRVLHIGDTLTSDFRRAQERGMVAYLYPKVVQRAIDRSEAFRRFLGRKPTLSRRRLVASVAVAHHMGLARQGKSSVLTDVAYQLLSVIGFAYAKFICDDARKRHINKLLLVARDGYVLEPLVRLVDPHLQTYYVYAPRRDYLIATQNFFDNSYVPLWRQWLAKGKPSFQHRKIAVELLKEWCQGKIDWNEESEIKFLAGGDCTKDLQSRLDSFSSFVKNEYARYIASLGFSASDHAALVDITSVRGTAHRLLQSFVPMKLHAYYYFRNTGRKSDWTFPDSTPFTAGDTSFCVDQGLVEYFFSAPTPSVKCVRGCKPVYDSTISFYDKFKFDCVELTRRVAEECVHLFARWDLNVPTEDFIDWKENLIAEIASRHASEFSFVRESFGVANTMTFSPFETLIRRPLHLRFFGRVLLTAEVSVWGLKRYATFKLFGRLPIFKLRIWR